MVKSQHCPIGEEVRDVYNGRYLACFVKQQSSKHQKYQNITAKPWAKTIPAFLPQSHDPHQVRSSRKQTLSLTKKY